MEGLTGALSVMPVEDLLEYLTRRCLDGTVLCERGTAQKSVVLRGGQVTGAASNDPREYLGQFLINYGHINEEQLSQAFETQQETRIMLGRILVMIGLVDEAVIQQVLAIKIRETLLSVLEWDSGTFHFDPTRGDLEEGVVEVAVTLDEVLAEAEFRRTAWEAIRQVFPTGEAALEVDASKIPEVPEHPLDARILALARRGEPIDSIALALHATPFALYQRLFALHRAGIVSPVEAGHVELELDFEVEEATELEDEPLQLPDQEIPEVLGAETPVAEILGRARDFLRAGKYREARHLATRALELAPDDADGHTALKEAETGLLAELRGQLLARPLSPRVIASGAQLRGLRFTPAERYLLKRFDGKRTLKQIIRVSPIKEVDALEAVHRFLKGGVIRLVEPPR